jgi:hypothetical protein
VYQIAGRHGFALLPPPSLPARDHPARDLALSPFTLSYRDVEELLAERGLDISYETVRRWVLKFGPAIATAAPVSPSAERSLAFGELPARITSRVKRPRH